MKKYKLLVFLTQIILIVLFMLFWEIGAKKGLINSFIFSSPSKILETLFNLIKSKEIFSHIFTTLMEIIISFSIGILIGFLLSIILYSFKFIADVFDPFLTMLNSLPKVALGPIIIIWVGANTKSIIVMALLINVIISTLTIYNGFINTDKLKLKLFKTFHASKIQILTKLVIPHNISTIISALKINISLTLIGLLPPVGENLFLINIVVDIYFIIFNYNFVN